MKHTSKTICVLLSIVMVLGLMPATLLTATAATVKMETKDGYLFFEAENSKHESDRFELISDKMFSGGKALSVTSEDKADPPKDATPDIDLSFKADVTGAYTVWMRNTASGTDAGQSVYLSYGPGAPYAWTKIDGTPEKPVWTKLCSLNAAAGETASVKLRKRQMVSINIDCFVITKATAKPDDVALGIVKQTPTPSPTAPPSADKIAIKTSGGNAVVEAESLKFNTDKLEKVSGDDLSGKAGLSVTREDKTKPEPNAKPDLDLSFVADKAGSYTVWMRAAATQDNSSGNSVFLSYPGRDYDYTVIAGQPESPEWTKLCSIPVGAGGVGAVKIIARQTYQIRIDKFIITANKGFNPSGKDPDPNSTSMAKLPSGVYPVPTVTPPTGHPKLFFTAKDVPNIKANMDAPQNLAAKAAWQANMAYNSDGTFQDLSGKSNYDYKVFSKIEALALDYAINKNTESGKQAVSMMLNALESADFNAHQFKVRVLGRMVMTAAKVYDWCYDIISVEDRKTIAASASSHATGLSIQYPPGGMGSIVGHGAEGQLLYHLMSFAIATYDEYPDIYNYVAGRFFAEYVEPRDFYYKSGAYHQGSSYVRYTADILAAWMFKRMSGVDVISDDFHKVFYELLYRRRPDGQNIRTGDDFNEYGNSPATYWSVYGPTLFYGANYYNDPYLKREYQKIAPNMDKFFEDDEGSFSATMHLIMNDPTLEGKSVDALPQTSYMGSPNGSMIARTGWDDGFKSPTVLAYMKIGELWSSNHEHLDSGDFQIYYKGALATDSGYYGAGYGVPHDYNYHKRTISTNGLRIIDPNEKMNYYGEVANDGGQKTPANGGEPKDMKTWMNGEYERAQVIGHEFGPDPVKPEYSYLAGDLTKAYSEKVSDVVRNMVFLPLEDTDHPATFVVMDKITSTDASFKKIFTIHTQEEPLVYGNKSVVERTTGGYGGRMVNETLLPAQVDINTIGGPGKQWMIGERNFDYTAIATPASETGWGRIEISPKAANETDYFLNVMTVSDAGTTAADIKSTLIEGDKYAGAVVADRVAVFAKDKSKINDSLSFTIPAADKDSYKVFVAGLAAGKWSVGNQDVLVSEEGGVAYFTANAGNVTLTYKDATKKPAQAAPVLPDVDTIGIKVKNMFIYSDVPAFIENDRTLVPMRAIFEALDASVDFDQATMTATATKDGREVKITEGSKTAYIDGEAKELDVTATIKDDRFVVPVRFISESFGAKVVWDPHAKVVLITPGTIARPNTNTNIATIVDAKESGHFESQDVFASFDGDQETLWSIGEIGAWVQYEFDKEYTIESMYIMLNKATERKAVFDLYSSTDGTNFTPIVTNAKADGKTDGETYKFPSPVKAKYIKYVAKGSDISEWSAIKEIQFNIKK